MESAWRRIFRATNQSLSTFKTVKVGENDFDVPHFFAALSVYHTSGSNAQIQPVIDMCGWAGDLATYAKELSTNSELSFPAGTFGMGDFTADLDAVNIYRMKEEYNTYSDIMTSYFEDITDQSRVEQFITNELGLTDEYTLEQLTTALNTKFSAEYSLVQSQSATATSLGIPSGLSSTDIANACTKMAEYLYSNVSVELNETNSVASLTNGENTTYYADATALINAFAEGNTLSGSLALYQDIDLGENALFVSNNCELTVSGEHTIRSDSTVFGNFGTLTINDGTLSSEYMSTIINLEGAKLTISGGTLSSKNSYSINNYNGAKLTISGGTVSSENDKAISNFGTVEINGGTVTSTSYFSSVIENDGTLTISGGTVQSTSEASIAISNSGTLTIYGGTVTSTSEYFDAISNNGTLTISGGTVSNIENSGALEISEDAEVNGTVSNYDCGELTISGGIVSNIENSGALEISEDAEVNGTVYNYDCGELTIKGGTVSSENDIAIDNSGTLTISGGTVFSEIINDGTVEISGGTFSLMPEADWLKDGYCVGENEGEYTVNKHELDENGYCASCHKVEGDIKALGFNLLLDGKVGVKITFVASEDVESVTINGTEYELTTPDENGICTCTYSLPAKDLNSDITVNYNGNELVSVTAELLAEIYASSSDSNVKAVAESLLDYSKACDNYFNGSENAITHTERETVSEKLYSVTIPEIVSNVADFEYYGSSLLCKDSLIVRTYFEYTGSETNAETIMSKFAGATGVKSNVEGTKFYVYVDKAFTMANLNESNAYGYSALCYIKKVVDHEEENEKLVDLCCALFDCHASAKIMITG